ncbi:MULTISPECIES: type VI secretion system amidase immunity protein Tai4 [Pseudomonas syringae group]|uniref:type VI secretion system amidase immunity protein Tai4 n=1 Tax=Pseudomonas syringae group TaxID=136849 RepID=UPI000E3E95E3|nr:MULTISPECIES: type VI secretion system amidase immunity protein Tai4 [Pseudomonas syringae group]MDU8604976.1 type VI secretion system amidase immunity protein Tai4 [Pseudomonas syringae group sp. 247E2]MDU8629333.1 type VI secretion system amidase immunity protein Tai4 [Pseudomonas syringae group sp. 243L2]MDU8645842.1 type VI secretion system amidase immunity protein Tai4 [Pseudomonas syringae group sp. 26L6]
MKLIVTAITVCLALLATESFAHTKSSSPEGMHRSYEQNFKDLVLATCIANAYASDVKVGIDAGSSVTAIEDWANYDWEVGPDGIRALVSKYLARDYTNPLTESEIKGVKFDLLKCLDLYHSKELNALTKKTVVNPTHTYMQDYK